MIHSDQPRTLGVATAAENFHQHRVRLYMKILVAFFATFLVGAVIKYFAVYHSGMHQWLQATRNGTLLFFVIACVLTAAWLHVRHHSHQTRTLQIIDSAGTVLTCGGLAGLVMFIPVGTGEFAVLLMLILILILRAGIVPSSGGRTLVVGLLAASPLCTIMWMRSLGADPELEPVVYLGGLLVLVWGIIFSVATMIISRIIYGLRTRLRELGSYRLVKRLGRGGMGEVWRAEHQMLARPAAIKMIRAESLGAAGDPSASLARFEQEAQATAALTCPHTIHLFDFGRAEDGSFYYVMELLDGLDLETLVREYGPQPPARVAHILAQVSRSLDEAHLTGHIHRDIKPANIFLCRYGADLDFVKVLDFGLVKHREEPTNSGITQDGIAVGTPAYMAPELILGDPEPDGRSDLYGLGCVGYWLLTGGLIFDAPNATALLVKHVNEDPVPPSQRSEFDIPPDLDAVIMDCVRKKPEGRPPSARALRVRLEALDLDWSEHQAESWWQNHRPV